jgi:hypothetical protein
MNKEEVFSAWAPAESTWSRWAKPVLFAYLDAASSDSAETDAPVDVSYAPASSDNVALLVDLPGREGVVAGIAFAAIGYRPVPLYNAIPLPSQDPPDIHIGLAAVSVTPIIRALKNGAEQVAQVNLPADAPPAFLLDANRAAEGKLDPRAFDNRSLILTTDFPSANFLASKGIHRALLVQRGGAEPQTDLAHVLRRWQDGGIQLERTTIGSSEKTEPFEIARPTWYGAMFQRAFASIGFRRGWSGGFGAWVSAGG